MGLQHKNHTILVCAHQSVLFIPRQSADRFVSTCQPLAGAPYWLVMASGMRSLSGSASFARSPSLPPPHPSLSIGFGSPGPLFGNARLFLLSVCRGTAAIFGPAAAFVTAERDEGQRGCDFFFFKFNLVSFQLSFPFHLELGFFL